MQTRPAIGRIEGIDGKFCISDKDKSNALNKFFSSAFMTEDPNTAPSFHVDKMMTFLSPVLLLIHLLCLKN